MQCVFTVSDTSQEPNTNARETYAPPHKVLTNDDLLTEIFIRLPILCIHLFTCFSKQLLKILISPAFTLKHSQIRCLDSPAGLFANHIRSSFDCDFVSLDHRINSRKYTIENSFTLGSTEEADKVKILESCNGLLQCTGLPRHAFDYVYNTFINLLKILPEPDYANSINCTHKLCRSAAKSKSIDVSVSTYSIILSNKDLELAAAASPSIHGKKAIFEVNVERVISFNRQIRNIDPPAGLFVNHVTSSFHCVFVSLDTRIKSTKYTSDKSFTLGYTEAVVNVNILQSCNETDYAHDDSNFYGCAGLRLAFDPTKSLDYKVLSKYIINTDDFMNPLPKGWSIRSIVWSIVLGEKEEDSFIIINLSTKVVQYNLISKTLREIYDMGSNEIANDYLHGFIPPYAIINSRKYTVENSFTLGSTEEADKVKILRSCNGLLLCTGLLRHAFDYVYNPFTNLLKILPEPDYANVDSNV
nr:hypothetical protein [Tanacetum cinerariifolium]